jgi:hypothetical protein
MSNRFFDQLQHLQQPGAVAPALSTLVSYSQQQQWPNQGPDDDSVELDDDDDLAAAADSTEALDDDDDDLTGGVDSADDDTDDLRAKALSAERQKNNRLERELRTMKQQLSQLSKINPEEYERLKDADRQKEALEREIANRERQLQLSADRKVRTVAKERDAALAQVEELRKDRLLERLFIDAEGRAGGDNRGSFFDIFKQQVGGEFKLEKDGNGRDQLVPIDSKGNPLLGNDGQVNANEHVEGLRTHPVLSFLFQQRGGLGPATTIAEFDGNGNISNLQDMTPSELYRVTFAKKPAGARH